jgi:L-ascorbate metabolism protein UlaG (beta-lactamase superfamily)
MGLIVKGPDAVLYIDPCLSDIIEARAFPPPLSPQQAASHATYVLVTHEHIDHLDPKTLGPMAEAAPELRFVVSGWGLEQMDQLNIADDRLVLPPALERITLLDTSARLTAVPSAHYDKEHDPQKGHRWLGYLIEWNGVTLYHSGDTIIYPDYLETMLGLPTADVALVAVNGRDYFRDEVDHLKGNLWPVEAARLSKHLGWDVLIPGHNDLLPRNTIPASHIVDALDRDAPDQKFKLLRPGELYYYVK